MPPGDNPFVPEGDCDLRDTVSVYRCGEFPEACGNFAWFEMTLAEVNCVSLGGEHWREADAPVRWRGQCIRP